MQLVNEVFRMDGKVNGVKANKVDFVNLDNIVELVQSNNIRIFSKLLEPYLYSWHFDFIQMQEDGVLDHNHPDYKKLRSTLDYINYDLHSFIVNPFIKKFISKYHNYCYPVSKLNGKLAETDYSIVRANNYIVFDVLSVADEDQAPVNITFIVYNTGMIEYALDLCTLDDSEGYINLVDKVSLPRLFNISDICSIFMQ